MSVMRLTDFVAQITWLGRVPAKQAGVQSQAETAMFARFDGVEGEVHGGLTRPSCGRVSALYKVGTKIANARQFSVLSEEELAQIAQAMGLPALDPGLLGASMVLRGIPDFSHVPPGSRLQGASGATLVVDLENRPCNVPAKGIDKVHAGYGPAFKSAAKGRRGITAWVEAEGLLTVGDQIRLHIPDQPPWAALSNLSHNP
jgi:hypothetical protein